MELLERSAKMTAYEEPAWERSQIRVPREDGTFLIRPDPVAISALIEQLRHRDELRDEADCRILNRQLFEFRNQARREIVAAATQWTSDLLGRHSDGSATGPLVMTGHQPELFHPGVFAKNIATSELANRAGGVGLNLVVDNDLMASTRIRVPVGNRNKPGITALEFDESREPLPWEEARVVNLPLLNSFSDRVSDVMSHWQIEPLVTQFWPTVVAQAEKGSNSGKAASLAECLTAGRATLERDLGLGNLELPISRLCETDTFRAFAAHILLNASKFCKVYNQVLTEYRRIHRLRSTSHPVPELQIQNGWCETPFWIWRADDPRRGRLFVRQSGDTIVFATAPDESTAVASLSLNPDSDWTEAVVAMRKLRDAGLRLRTRALTTTLFSRLCLCDLFIHGIGGAKYDALTDHIAFRFFGRSLPTYLTLSATTWLPIGDPHTATDSDVARLRQMLRELQQNPQRHVGSNLSVDAQSLVAEKLSLIAQQNSSDASGSAATSSARGHTRYRRFPEINRALAKLTQRQQHRIREELALTEQQLAANRILTSRECSLCLYPAESIHRMIDNLRKQLSPTAD
ncbi:MAG: hypothetical protein O3B86_16345 [Planctomycetota bacterium]|nr:hypothetical protein [Planctomycetota bacterium]